MKMIAELFMRLINHGITLGLFLGIVILLRPVTNRLLSPSQRTALWGVVWVTGYISQNVDVMTYIPIPFPTLRDLLIPRTGRSGSFGGIPAFLPDVDGAGTYNLALPGGIVVPFRITEGLMIVIGAVGAAYLLAGVLFAFRQDRRVSKLTKSGTPLDQAKSERLGIQEESDIQVRLCPDLPTSFVVRGSEEHIIALQQELTDEQLRLVFLHEREHVRRRDTWLHGIISVALVICFWNPVIWLAYYLTRRDMELACDQGVLKQLDEKERREYARTLVELASDRPVWGGVTTFGECDAALRVRRAVEWQPGQAKSRWKNVLGWAAAALLAVFLVAGGPRDKIIAEDVALEMDQMNAWTAIDQRLEELRISMDDGAAIWANRDGSYYCVAFQDTDGAWWELEFFRGRQGNLVAKVNLNPVCGAPDLEGFCQIHRPLE